MQCRKPTSYRGYVPFPQPLESSQLRLTRYLNKEDLFHSSMIDPSIRHVLHIGSDFLRAQLAIAGGYDPG